MSNADTRSGREARYRLMPLDFKATISPFFERSEKGERCEEDRHRHGVKTDPGNSESKMRRDLVCRGVIAQEHPNRGRKSE